MSALAALGPSHARGASYVSGDLLRGIVTLLNVLPVIDSQTVKRRERMLFVPPIRA
jgi:hypothetical protein